MAKQPQIVLSDIRPHLNVTPAGGEVRYNVITLHGNNFDQVQSVKIVDTSNTYLFTPETIEIDPGQPDSLYYKYLNPQKLRLRRIVVTAIHSDKGPFGDGDDSILQFTLAPIPDPQPSLPVSQSFPTDDSTELATP